MSNKENLNLQVKHEFKKQLREKADEKGLTLSGYTRMKLKEAV